MRQEGEICDHFYEKQKDGTFIYKAKQDNVSLQKIKIKSKQQYKEKPQYKLIEIYEEESRSKFQQNIKSLVFEVIEILKK